MNLANVSKEKQSKAPGNDERLDGVREERVGSHRLKASLRLEEQWSDVERRSYWERTVCLVVNIL